MVSSEDVAIEQTYWDQSVVGKKKSWRSFSSQAFSGKLQYNYFCFGVFELKKKNFHLL